MISTVMMSPVLIVNVSFAASIICCSLFLGQQLEEQDGHAVVKAGLGAPVAGWDVGVFAAHLAGLVEPEVF
jgi:hypothetical protein